MSEPIRQLRQEMGDEEFEKWLRQSIHEIIETVFREEDDERAKEEGQ